MRLRRFRWRSRRCRPAVVYEAQRDDASRRRKPRRPHGKEHWSLRGMRVAPGDVLADYDIRALARAGFLVTRDGAPIEAEQATLDVHMSVDVMGLDEDLRQARRHAKDGMVVISPGETLSIRTEELFFVPLDVQGQVSPKAFLTTLGLTFPTTYVDPGFSNHLFLPVSNVGQSPIRLPVGRAIGKVQLQRLRRPVREAWQGAPKFRDFASELVVRRQPLEERLNRLEARGRILTGAALLLLGVVLGMLFEEPISDLPGISGGAVRDYAIPIVAGIVLPIVVLAARVLTKRTRWLWSKLMLRDDAAHREEAS